MYSDKTLTCKDCGAEFTFSAAEQEFYASKGFEHEPARCPDCRRKRKQAKNADREMYTVICDQCGAETQVPFRPTNGRPIYCRDCMDNRNRD